MGRVLSAKFRQVMDCRNSMDVCGWFMKMGAFLYALLVCVSIYFCFCVSAYLRICVSLYLCICVSMYIYVASATSGSLDAASASIPSQSGSLAPSNYQPMIITVWSRSSWLTSPSSIIITVLQCWLFDKRKLLAEEKMPNISTISTNLPVHTRTLVPNIWPPWNGFLSWSMV